MNMMAVASYDDTDYYKCKYCKYVAPVSNNVSQNYIYQYVDNQYHKVTNVVNGLEYTFYAKHVVDNMICTSCNQHIHKYTFQYIDERHHSELCTCMNQPKITLHTILESDYLDGNNWAKCIGCKRKLNLDSLIVYPVVPTMNNHYSENGSYYLVDSLIILVDSEIEKYYNGTLKFDNYEIS